MTPRWRITGSGINRFIRPAPSSCKTMATICGSKTFTSASCPARKQPLPNPMRHAIDRRQFLKTTAVALVGASSLAAKPRKLSANEKLNIGVIGVSNRGGENLQGVASENIVALCDVDEKLLGAAAQKFPSAK